MHFNPRSHERSDVFAFPAAVFAEISIHAPTRGATSALYSPPYFLRLFQSTLPREERRIVSCCCGLNAAFQSTLPREERPSSVFNFFVSSISIHAPTRGATADWIMGMSMSRVISIHAPTRGATAILHKKFVYFYTIPTINI